MRAPCLGLTLLLAAPAACGAVDLLSVYRQALVKDDAYQAALATARAEGLETRKAAAGLLPQIAFTGQASRNDTENILKNAAGGQTRTESAYLSESYGLSLRQPLIKPQGWAQMLESGSVSRRAKAVLRGEEQALALRTAQAYFEALLADAQFRMEGARKASYEQTLLLAEKALKSGAGTVTDVFDLRARRDLAEALEFEARNARDGAMAALEALTAAAVPALAPVEIQKLPLKLDMGTAEDWLARAEAANPALQELRADLDAARYELRRTQSGYFPTLDLVANHRRASNESEVSINRESKTSLVGLQVNMPLFSGGYTRAASLQAQARADAAERSLEAGRRALGLAVRRELGNLRQNAAKVTALEQAMASVEQALAGTEKGLAAGTRTAVDVINAQDLVFRTKVELIKAAHGFVLSSLKLQSACGALDESAVGAVNLWLASEPQP